MRCEWCGEDAEGMALVPMGKEGAYESFSCILCAVKNDVWCQQHQIPHTGFDDRESTACIPCINEEVAARGEEIEWRFNQAIAGTAHEPFIRQALTEYLDDLLPLGLLRQTARVIVTRAFRTRFSVDEVIEQVARQGPQIILPWYQD